MPLHSKSAFDRYYLLLVILLHVFYFAAACIIRSIYTLDSYEYIWQAFNLKEYLSNYCHDLSEPVKTELYTRRTVLYGFLLMAGKWVYASDFTILAIQNVVSILNMYFFWKLLKGYSFGFNPGPVILAAFLLFPTWMIYTNMVMSELVFATCILWTFYAIIRYSHHKKFHHLILYNIFITLAVLTKPVLLYFWLPHLVLMGYFLYRTGNWRILLPAMLMPTAIFLHCIANMHSTGHFHYSSIKNHNLLHYNSQILLAHAGGLEWSRKKVDSLQTEAEKMPDFEAYNAFIVKECYDIHKQEFPVFLKIQSGGMLNFFIDPGRYDMEQFFPPKNVLKMSFFHQLREKGLTGVVEYAQKMPLMKILVMGLIMIWNALLFTSTVLFIFNRRVDMFTRIMLLLLVGYVCILTGPMGDSRFRMAVYPLLVFTMPFFLQALKEWNDKRRQKFAVKG